MLKYTSTTYTNNIPIPLDFNGTFIVTIANKIINYSTLYKALAQIFSSDWYNTQWIPHIIDTYLQKNTPIYNLSKKHRNNSD